jgi:hypothetical protein
MSFYVHGWDIHAVWSGTGDSGVTGARSGLRTATHAADKRRQHLRRRTATHAADKRRQEFRRHTATHAASEAAPGTQAGGRCG